MKARVLAGRFFFVATIAVAGVLGAACDADAPSTLDPKGSGAERIAGLTYLLLVISAIVFVIVTIGLVVSILRGRRKPDDVDTREVRWGSPFILVSGGVIPALVLAGVFTVSVRDQALLSRAAEDSVMTIDVVGHLWWWEARYPNGAVTANEIHIPVGEKVRLRLTTDDVIHSFWVPQLQAKTDTINGHVNYMWLDALEPGRYRGQCAEFCGVQHAKMLFYVVAEPRPAFDEWVANEALDVAAPFTPTAETGERVFLEGSCAGCHAIRGTPADQTLGPDLTHLATRETLASGIIPNTTENLEELILHPQSVKPGIVMPPTSLSEDELAALVEYLQQLR
ncbi:MAG TPA: cytochrome c oxidase subunit II [Actinomycetota bacterium]